VQQPVYGLARKWIIIIAVGFGVLAIYGLSKIQISAPHVAEQTPVIEPASPPATRPVRLYFYEPKRRQLVPERHEIILEADNFSSQVKSVITALIRGPVADTLGATFPPTATLNAVYLVEPQQLVLDFSPALQYDLAPSATSELLLLTSLVRTVGDAFPQVGTIQLLIDGQPATKLTGHLDIQDTRFYIAGAIE